MLKTPPAFSIFFLLFSCFILRHSFHASISTEFSAAGNISFFPRPPIMLMTEAGGSFCTKSVIIHNNKKKKIDRILECSGKIVKGGC